MAVRKLAPEELQPDELRVHARERGVGGRADRQVPAGPAGLGGDRAAVAGAGAGRRLAAAEGDRGGRREARHAGDPRAWRSRPSTRCSTSIRWGSTSSSSAARRRARCAARARSRRCCERRVGEERHVSADGNFLLARGRVPRRLLQRPDGADQRRLLRGPDAGELREAPRRPRGRPAREGRLAERPARLRAAEATSNTLTDPALYDGSVVGAWRKRFEEEAVQAADTGEAAAAAASVPRGGQGREAASRPGHREPSRRHAGQAREGGRGAGRAATEGRRRAAKATASSRAPDGQTPAPQSAKSYVATPSQAGRRQGRAGRADDPGRRHAGLPTPRPAATAPSPSRMCVATEDDKSS